MSEIQLTFVDAVPCRFCHQRPRVGDYHDGDEGYSAVECPGLDDGHFVGVHGDSVHEAVRTWNGMMTP